MESYEFYSILYLLLQRSCTAAAVLLLQCCCCTAAVPLLFQAPPRTGPRVGPRMDPRIGHNSAKSFCLEGICMSSTDSSELIAMPSGQNDRAELRPILGPILYGICTRPESLQQQHCSCTAAAALQQHCSCAAAAALLWKPIEFYSIL